MHGYPLGDEHRPRPRYRCTNLISQRRDFEQSFDERIGHESQTAAFPPNNLSHHIARRCIVRLPETT